MNLVHRWFCRSSRWQAALENGLPWVLDGIDLGDHLLEVGPGPGLATDLLQRDHPRMVSVEIDGDLAIESKRRLREKARVLACIGCPRTHRCGKREANGTQVARHQYALVFCLEISPE